MRKVRFRLRMPDGEIMYEGIQYLTPGGTSQGTILQECLSPLVDFGMPVAGCTIIDQHWDSWAQLIDLEKGKFDNDTSR